MITSFHDSITESIFNKKFVKAVHPHLAKKAKKKLDQLNGATNLDELKIPSGNELEPLEGDRKGQHSIRVNEQWRICFIWNNGNAERVEFCDYH